MLDASHKSVWLEKPLEDGFSENIYTHPSPESNTPKYLHLQILLLSPNKLSFYTFSVLQIL